MVIIFEVYHEWQWRNEPFPIVNTEHCEQAFWPWLPSMTRGEHVFPTHTRALTVGEEALVIMSDGLFVSFCFDRQNNATGSNRYLILSIHKSLSLSLFNP